jgi:predicted transcriptional regulator
VIEVITLNDYSILQAIIDEDDDEKGFIKTKGTTKKEIQDKTNLSTTKITTTLIKFQAQELIELALKVKNSNSYVLTEKGMTELLGMKGMLKNE